MELASDSLLVAQESVLDVEYIFAVTPPDLKQQLPHDDWYGVSCWLSHVPSHCCMHYRCSFLLGKTNMVLPEGSELWMAAEQALSSAAATTECSKYGTVHIYPQTVRL